MHNPAILDTVSFYTTMGVGDAGYAGLAKVPGLEIARKGLAYFQQQKLRTGN
jgi:hypothetical protein